MNENLLRKKIIALFVSIVIFVSGFANNLMLDRVFADSIDKELYESENEELIEEATIDENSKISAGSWNLIFKYNLSWGYFHRKVQERIRDRYSSYGMQEKEMRIYYENGKYGSADLVLLDDTNTYYLWEVKPYSYIMEENRKKGLEQLDRYINGVHEYGRSFDNGKNYNDGKTGDSYNKDKNNKEGIYGETFVFEEGDGIFFKISYYVEDDGLILYRFKEITQEEYDANDLSEVEIKYRKSKDITKAKTNARNEVLTKVSTTIPATKVENVEEEKNYINYSSLLLADLLVTDMYDECCKKMGQNFVDVFNIESILDFRNIDDVFDALNLDIGNATIYEMTAAIVYPVKLKLDSYVRDEDGNIIERTGKVEYTSEMSYVIETLLLDYFQVMEDDEYAEIARFILFNTDDDRIEEDLNHIKMYVMLYNRAGEAQPPRDPLIIDLQNDGIDLVSIDNGVYFDLDNNGFAEKTAWIGIQDGFLAMDRNGNGKIDNGGELFGDQVTLIDGSKSNSGFEALQELDDNEDDAITEEDEAFDDLLVWVDANHNGRTDAGELNSLSYWNIQSISLIYNIISFTDEETGARIAETAEVLIDEDSDEITTTISEFWFPVNSADTTSGDNITVGNVPDLLQAIEEDESGTLLNLFLDFSESEDIAEKHYFAKQILYYITDSQDINPGSRGGNIDARDLHVIEAFMGRGFVGVGGSDPNVNAAEILKGIYNGIEEDYYSLINIYCAAGGYLHAVASYTDENGNESVLLDVLFDILDEKVNSGEKIDWLIYDLALYFRQYDENHGTDSYNRFTSHYNTYSEVYAQLENTYTYIGTDASDSYSGISGTDYIFGESGNDLLNGGSGNDYIYGFDGDDTLNGNSGNDTLKGGNGDDTYMFSMGYGNDIVIDAEGNNSIRLSGINKNDVLINGIGSDAVIMLKSSNDTLTLVDFITDENSRNYCLIFDDAQMDADDQESPFRHIYGNDSSNTLKAVLDDSIMHAFGGDDSVYGSNGDDIIYGNEGDDTIYAGYGNDIVYGGNGNDVIDGGSGRNVLYGGPGNDSYVLSGNQGRIVISDGEGTTYIVADEIDIDDIIVYELGENLIVLANDGETELIISGFAGETESYYLILNGEEIPISSLISDYEHEYLTGTENMDWIVNDGFEMIASDSDNDGIIGNDSAEYAFGDSGNDQILVNDDNDTVFGGSENDYINGGIGNDYIDMGTGNDFSDGNTGDDIYVFLEGYGEDSIMDSDGNNTIMFGDGFNADDIIAYRSNWNDLLITFPYSDDTLTLKYYCVSDSARNYRLIFADGTVVDATDADSPLRTIYGTDGGEFMISIYDDGITKIGQGGDDQIVGGNGNDFLKGSSGNEIISGCAGNDVLDGGTGDDCLYGEEGNDTYIFKKGYGTDTIYDCLGSNRIEIYGFSAAQFVAYRTNWNDLTLCFNGSDDKLVIAGFFTSPECRNYYVAFNGYGSFHAAASNSPFRTINGTEEDDYMLAMDDNGVTLIGNGSDDSINGGNGNDSLYGNSGNDIISGNDGNDRLDGGTGADMLYGGAGNDTYVFGETYGIDIIEDSEGYNMIVFGNGIQPSSITAYRVNWNDLLVVFEDIDDTLTIRNYFVSEDYRRYNLQFTDGSEFAYDSDDNPFSFVHLSDGNDWCNAWSDNGIRLYGDDGSDQLIGGIGEDVLTGGTGNDYLAGGQGADVYVYNSGDGSDMIDDQEGENIIDFVEIPIDSVNYIENVSGNLNISFTDCDDVVVILGYNSDNYIFKFAENQLIKFVGGSVVNITE